MIHALVLAAALSAPISPEAANEAALRAYRSAKERIASLPVTATTPEVTSYGSQTLGKALVVTFSVQDRDANSGVKQVIIFAPYHAEWRCKATRMHVTQTTYNGFAMATFCDPESMSSLLLVPFQPLEPCASEWKVKIEWGEPEVLVEWTEGGCGTNAPERP